MDEASVEKTLEIAVWLIHNAWPDPGDDKFIHDVTLWPRQSQMARQLIHIHATFSKRSELQFSKATLLKLVEILTKCSFFYYEMKDLEVAKRMLELPLGIVTSRSEDDNLSWLCPDVTFLMQSIAVAMNDIDMAMVYGEVHFESRLKDERRKPALSEFAAMAYSALVDSLLLSGQYSKVPALCETGLRIYKNAPEYDRALHWPHFVIIHHAWALLGLKQASLAVEMLEETVYWGEMRFRKTGDPSFKHAYALHALGRVQVALGQYAQSLTIIDLMQLIRLQWESIFTPWAMYA